MNNKKILYFDYWTIGLHNFKLFDHHLKANGFDTKLFHIGSWRNKTPDFQVIQNIPCCDIRHYKTNLIHKVLERERPQALVMLNSTHITDRSVILSCRKLGIETIYLAHGTLMQEDDKNIAVVNQSFKGTKVRRALKHIKGTLINFLYSSFKYDWKNVFRLHAYKVIFESFFSPATYLFFPPPSFDLRPDLTLVYGENDAQFFKDRQDKARIKIVGNPELDSYFLNLNSLASNREEFLSENKIPLSKPYVIYVEEGTVEDKLWTNEDRLHFVKEIYEACERQGRHLVIKLHPRTFNGPHYASFLALDKITILTKTNIPKLVFFADRCISHYSTVLIYPMLLNKPILVPRWGNSLTLFAANTEKEVTFVNSKADLDNLLICNTLVYDRAEYLNKFVPFRDGRTSERIAEYILEKTNDSLE
jgi:hypothetical protein